MQAAKKYLKTTMQECKILDCEVRKISQYDIPESEDLNSEARKRKESQNKYEEPCPECDESGCSIYDCELCLAGGGTHLLKDITPPWVYLIS